MKVDKDLYFLLFSNCVPVKGYARSIICDLQLSKYYFIPNDLYDILLRSKKQKVGNFYEEYGIENVKVLDEYFEFLINNNVGILDNEPNVFPDMSLDWETPSKITNAIIDLPNLEIELKLYQKAIDELSVLNCTCLEIRSFSNYNLEVLMSLLDFTLDSRIKEIRLVLPFRENLDKKTIEKIIIKHKRIEYIIFHQSYDYQLDEIKGVKVKYVKDLLSCKSCGQVNKFSFIVNIPFFTESQKFNNCLNRKISIDSNGNIKNCPSQKEHFGNIESKSLSEVLEEKDFFKYWSISKDNISICKDCEFRYICTDCRVFVSNSNNQYSKPLNCTYDPYTASWK